MKKLRMTAALAAVLCLAGAGAFVDLSGYAQQETTAKMATETSGGAKLGYK